MAIASAQAAPKSLQDLAVPHCGDRCGVAVDVFHPDGAGNALRADCAPRRAFLAVQWRFCYLFRWLGAPVTVVLAVDPPVQVKMCLIRKPDVFDELSGSASFSAKPGTLAFAGIFVAVAKLLVDGNLVRGAAAGQYEPFAVRCCSCSPAAG